MKSPKAMAYHYVAYLIQQAGAPDNWGRPELDELERIRVAMAAASVHAGHVVDRQHTNGATNEGE